MMRMSWHAARHTESKISLKRGFRTKLYKHFAVRESAASYDMFMLIVLGNSFYSSSSDGSSVFRSKRVSSFISLLISYAELKQILLASWSLSLSRWLQCSHLTSHYHPADWKIIQLTFQFYYCLQKGPSILFSRTNNTWRANLRYYFNGIITPFPILRIQTFYKICISAFSTPNL